MKNAYPIIMHKDGNWIYVDIPDFQIGSQGTDYADAMEMARDAIGAVGITMEDDGTPLPEPSRIESIDPDGGTVSLVDVDFSEYRKRNDTRTVRRSVTLPAWLNSAAEQAGINVSAVLRDALKSALHA